MPHQPSTAHDFAQRQHFVVPEEFEIWDAAKDYFFIPGSHVVSDVVGEDHI